MTHLKIHLEWFLLHRPEHGNSAAHNRQRRPCQQRDFVLHIASKTNRSIFAAIRDEQNQMNVKPSIEMCLLLNWDTSNSNLYTVKET